VGGAHVSARLLKCDVFRRVCVLSSILAATTQVDSTDYEHLSPYEVGGVVFGSFTLVVLELTRLQLGLAFMHEELSCLAYSLSMSSCFTALKTLRVPPSVLCVLVWFVGARSSTTTAPSFTWLPRFIQQ